MDPRDFFTPRQWNKVLEILHANRSLDTRIEAFRVWFERMDRQEKLAIGERGLLPAFAVYWLAYYGDTILQKYN